MKIQMHITLDVDEDAWREAYGAEPGDVRRLAKGYVIQLVERSGAAQSRAIRSACESTQCEDTEAAAPTA